MLAAPSHQLRSWTKCKVKKKWRRRTRTRMTRRRRMRRRKKIEKERKRKKEKRKRTKKTCTPAFISLCFLAVDAMWLLPHAPAALSSLPWWTVYPDTVSPSFLELLSSQPWEK